MLVATSRLSMAAEEPDKKRAVLLAVEHSPGEGLPALDQLNLIEKEGKVHLSF